MNLSLSDAKIILAAEKRLIGIGPWVNGPSRHRKDDVRAGFEARVEFNGVLRRGLWFRIYLWPRYPDVATFQLECDVPNSRRHLPLYRLDWHPFSSHVNGNNGPPELNGMFFDAGQTHEHICLYNADLNQEWILSDGVQVAAPIVPDPGNFKEAFSRVCAKLNLVNCEELPSPEFQIPWL